MKSGSPVWNSCGQALSTSVKVMIERAPNTAVPHTPQIAAAMPGTSTIQEMIRNSPMVW